MSQLHARLFEKWLSAGGDLTFSEWLTDRRTRAVQHRQQLAAYGKLAPGQLVRVTRAQLSALQQSQLAGAGIGRFIDNAALQNIFGGL